MPSLERWRASRCGPWRMSPMPEYVLFRNPVERALEHTHVLEFDYETIHDAFEDDFALYVHWARIVAGRRLELERKHPTGSATGAAPEAEIRDVDRPLGLLERILLLRGGPFPGLR